MPAEIEHAPAMILGTEPGGKLILQFQADYKLAEARAFVAEWRKRGAKEAVEVSMRILFPGRSLNQNRLGRALEAVLAFETCGTRSRETLESVHEGLLELLADDLQLWRENPITHRPEPTRSHTLDTKQFSRLIEIAFDKLAELGVRVETAAQISAYWIEWMRWRGKQAVDPVTYKSLADYDARVRICEACLVRLAPGEGHLAHIVGKGAGGDSIEIKGAAEPHRVWNRIKLCPEHHLWLDHAQGDGALIKEYPHLAWRWNKARAALGLAPIVPIGKRYRPLADKMKGEECDM